MTAPGPPHIEPEELINIGLPKTPLTTQPFSLGPLPTPPFGLGAQTYDLLIRLARDYVQTCSCTHLRDLAPEGYLEDRQIAEAHWAQTRDNVDSIDHFPVSSSSGATGRRRACWHRP